jgi:hypothetical protein
MAIEKIRPEDFPGPNPTGHRALTEESAAVMALQPGEVVRFPCRWRHRGSQCTGSNSLYQAGRRRGFRVSIRCRDKMVYVMRRIGENN